MLGISLGHCNRKNTGIKICGGEEKAKPITSHFFCKTKNDYQSILKSKMYL